jgi:DNA-binding MurR/RpiR family transcriptional regulator
MRVLDLNNSIIDDATVLERAVVMLSSAKRIIILGYGTSAVACNDLYIKLSRLGMDCHYSTDSHVNALTLEAEIGPLPDLREQDKDYPS